MSRLTAEVGVTLQPTVRLSTASRPDAYHRGRHRLGDAGFVTAWTVALSATCWLMVGLVVDSGRVLHARSEAFGAAASAARAGAQQLDERIAVAEGRLVLDENSARRAALDYLLARGFDGTVVTNGDLQVTVTVTDTVDLGIIPAPRAVTFQVSATAQAIEGAGR